MAPNLARSLLQTLGHTGRTAEAAALVLSGMSRTQAAKQVGVNVAAVIRLLNRYTITSTCPCCGAVTKSISLEAKPQ